MRYNYTSIVEDFKQNYRGYSDDWIEYCKNQNVLSEAIYFAARSEGYFGKKHPHQYRVKNIYLERFASKLLNNKQKIENATDFDTLLNVVNSSRVEGIGQLTVYDTATRIGAYKEIFPDKIYLHAGTKKGVENLLGKIKANFINKNTLPAEFKNSDLSCAELEDLFCLYKEDFRMGKNGCTSRYSQKPRFKKCFSNEVNRMPIV